MASHDICVVGHVTNDLITDTQGRRRNAVGGAAYYSGIALASLGMRTLIVSIVATRDLEAFGAAFGAHDIAIQFGESACSTTFENSYDQVTGRRSQRIEGIARGFRESDLAQIDAETIHLGPLTPDELPLECLTFLARRGVNLSLDLQGFVRNVADGDVHMADWPQKADFLQHVRMVKGNRWEAQAVTATNDPVSAARQLCQLGPDEVIVTLADKGAILCVGGAIFEIPAKAVSTNGDPTGCGDSFCAGYIFARLRGRAPRDSALFATVLAAEKRKREGPFTGTAQDIDALIAG